MANYLKGKNASYYAKHSKRVTSRTATRGERSYSRSWLSGFAEIWQDDGTHDISDCKNSFERTAYIRGKNFAQKVLNEKE